MALGASFFVRWKVPPAVGRRLAATWPALLHYRELLLLFRRQYGLDLRTVIGAQHRQFRGDGTGLHRIRGYLLG